MCELLDIALGREGEVAADEVDETAVLFPAGGEQAVDLASLAFLRREAFRLTDGIHDAFGKGDAGEALAQRLVDVAEVAAEEMVHAGREDEDGARQTRQAAEDVRDALDKERLMVRAVEVVLAELERGEAAAIGVSHLRRGQHDAAQAAGRADVDLMRLRQEHARVDDVPGAARGGGVLESRREGRGIGGLRDGEGREVLWRLDVLEHEIILLTGGDIANPARLFVWRGRRAESAVRIAAAAWQGGGRTL